MGRAESYIHELAFAGFISFCSSNLESIEAFERDTGLKIPTPRTPIESAIDEATGFRRDFVKQFIDWCADQYGRELLPEDLSVFMKPINNN